VTQTPTYLLFAQHGWADTRQAIATLADQLVEPGARAIAPDLGWLQTWLAFEPLVARVEQIAHQELARYPDAPLRVIGHSMGGLIWLELLARHPEWRSRLHSLVLIASPLGGADLARLLVLFGLGWGVARPLSDNRRPLAEAIAREVPTLTITGDIDGGSDGTTIAEATRCAYAQAVTLPIDHAGLKSHPASIPVIRDFWAAPQIAPAPAPTLANQLAARLRSLPGLHDAHRRDYRRARPLLQFADGTTLSAWRQPLLGTEHVFLSDRQGNLCFGGFVGGAERAALEAELAAIARDYQERLIGEPREERRAAERVAGAVSKLSG